MASLLVIPVGLRKFFQACHNDPTAGYLSYSGTLSKICEMYYWTKVPKSVHLYTRSCHECQRFQKPVMKPSRILQSIGSPTSPFQQTGMDLPGPFPTSTTGKRWIIVATHHLTRYVKTKALVYEPAVQVAQFFMELIVLQHRGSEILVAGKGISRLVQLT